MSPVREKIERPLKAMLKNLTIKELREAADFIFFLKTRAMINPGQTYFWTRQWQALEQRAEHDKRKGKIVGQGSIDSLLHALKP